MDKYLIFAWFVALIFVLGNAEILVGPQDIEAESEETVELHCKATLGNVEWQHLAIGAPIPELVYKDGFIYNGYNERFNVSSTIDGTNVLIIRYVKPSDAGKFTCLENSETTSQKAAELIVFERAPSNESCAGKYTCKPVCNELELSCEMKAHGNHIPSLQWIDNEERHLDSKEVIVNEATVSIVTLKTDPYVSAWYTCGLKYPSIQLTSKYSWTYATSVTKELESLLKAENQPKEESPSQSTVEIAAAIAIFAVIVCVVMAGVMIKMCMKAVQKKRKMKLEQLSSAEQIEINTGSDASKPLMSVLIDRNGNGDKFAPCTPASRGNPIHGLAAIDDEVFIITREGCVVEVFDIYGGGFKRFWPVEGLVNPNDMAACPTRKIIFICDWKKTAEDKEIICLDIHGNLQYRWFSEYERGRISITKESNVIVAESWYNTIKEYTSVGALKKTTKPGKEKFHLWHAVKLDDGNFVASFGDAKDDHKEICILDQEGQVIKSLTNDSNSNLSVPRSFAVDRKGNIYVCDLYNGRIIVLNPELEIKRYLYKTNTDGYTLNGPLRICMHENNNKTWLLVADSVKQGKNWRNGRVVLWNLQEPPVEGDSEL